MRYEILNDTFIRGERPKTVEDWLFLRRLGVKTCLNLEMGFYEFFHKHMNNFVEAAVCLNMTPLHIQLGDIRKPTVHELRTAWTLVDRARKDGYVFVCCEHGEDRTGLISAMERVKHEKWSIDTAIAEMYNLGFHRFPYETLGWVKVLKEVLV